MCAKAPESDMVLSFRESGTLILFRVLFRKIVVQRRTEQEPGHANHKPEASLLSLHDVFPLDQLRVTEYSTTAPRLRA